MVWVRFGTGAACDSAGITEAGGSDDATDEGSIFVVPMTRATVVGTGSCSSSGVGYPINSLKVAPRLVETRVSVTSIDKL